MTKASAAEKDRAENFPFNRRNLNKGNILQVNADADASVVNDKLTSLLEKFDKRVANMESQIARLSGKRDDKSRESHQNYKGNNWDCYRSSRKCKACSDNKLDNCWHCFKCGEEGHSFRFCYKGGKGN